VRGFTGSLLFRLTAVNYAVATFFILIAGFTVYRVSQDSIKQGVMAMATDMAEDVEQAIVLQRPDGELGDRLLMTKVKKTGSTWIMDGEGYLIFNPDPQFREEYIAKKKKFGNVVVNLQFATPRPSGTGTFKEKLIDIAGKYEEGFGTYSQFGVERILAFRSIPSRGLLIGVDEPVTSANSELERIKKYIFYTAMVSAVLIMVFSFLSTRIIIRPYYRHVEELNESLQYSNRQLENINAKLTASNKNLTTLHEIGLAMQQSLTLKDLLDKIISGAHDVLDIDRINLMLPSADGTFLECRAAIGNEAVTLGDIRVPVGSRGGALAAAFERKEIMRFEEGMKIPHSLRLQEPYAAVPFLRSRAFVVVPLVVKDHAVGVIAADNKMSKRSISEAQVNLMSIFANQAAVAVENARLYDELRRKIDELDSRVDQLSILHQIGNSMQRVTSLSDALGFIMRGIRESMGFTDVVLALVDREGKGLRGEIGLGAAEDEVKALRLSLAEEDNLLVMSVAGRRPVGIVHFAKSELIDVVGSGLLQGEYREVFNLSVAGARMAAVAVPLIAREEVIGALVVGRLEPPVIKRDEVELLMLYANTAALTVERSELYTTMHKDLENMEISDHVTALFTSRYGRQRLGEEIVRCQETKTSLAVALMGIDRFKEYNDLCGHEAGDRALGEVGALIKEELTGSDFAYRYGGRMMAAILPGRSLREAETVAEKILSRLRKHRFPGPAGEPDQVLTLSMGIVERGAGDQVPSESEIFATLLGLLDRAEAEGGGRSLTG